MHTSEETRHSSESDHLGTHCGPAEFGTRFFRANAIRSKGKFRKLAAWVVHTKKPVALEIDHLGWFFKTFTSDLVRSLIASDHSKKPSKGVLS